MTLIFQDRAGNRRTLDGRAGESLFGALLRQGIPPASVLVTGPDGPLPDSATIEPGVTYIAALIEGYDIAGLLEVQKALSGPAAMAGSPVFMHRLLALATDGALVPESAPLSLTDVAAHVEDLVEETCTHFKLLEGPDDPSVVLGLSGGVDSSSLAMALSAVSSRRGGGRILAVTFEDFDAGRSPTFAHAQALAAELGLDYEVAPASLAQEVFHLDRPLTQVLRELMDTRDAHHVMYVDHHTTRRVLEVFAERHGIFRIALGLHTTDLIAGLLNGWMTGYDVASIPRRKLGAFEYIYPLAFVTKQKLHLYHLSKTGHLARHSAQNDWEKKPLDRNFYYYLADLLQAYWPGLERQLFTAHGMRMRNQGRLECQHCPNCGSALLHQPFTDASEPLCDVCVVFRDAGYLQRED